MYDSHIENVGTKSINCVGVSRDAADEQFHREFGEHSGIPKCCIDHYIATIDNEMTDDEAIRAVEETIKVGWQHHPCPECRAAKRVIKIRSCADNCPKMLDIIARAELRYRNKQNGMV